MAAAWNDLLKKNADCTWFKTHEQAWSSLCSSLLSAPVLRFDDFKRQFELHTDGACTAGIGVILWERDPSNNKTYAIVYASRSLSKAERCYGVSEIEALGIIWGIKKFARYVTGTKFVMVTDRQPLQSLFKSSKLRGRLARWALMLQQHEYAIVYSPGKANAAADALSWHPVTPINSLLVHELVPKQHEDSFCTSITSPPPG